MSSFVMLTRYHTTRKVTTAILLSSPPINTFTRRAITTAQVTQKAAEVAKGTQSILGRVAALQKPIFYNLKVTGEIAKQVYIKEGLAPPTLEQIVIAKDHLVSAVRGFKLSTLRQVRSWDVAKYAVRTVEIAGFFFVGEVIGRRHLVGYKV